MPAQSGSCRNAWSAAAARIVAGAALLVAASGSAVRADEPASADGPTFFLTGYVWASALSGRTATLSPLPPADIDLSFADTLENLDLAFMGAGEVRSGRWGFLADMMYLQVTPEAKLPGSSSGELRSRSFTFQSNILYRLHDDGRVRFDIGGGLRYWKLHNRLTVELGRPDLSVRHSESEEWVDPVVMARAAVGLGGSWRATLAADIGGFGLGSRLTYQVLGTIDYAWTDRLMLRAGYRLLSVDYETDDFLYDVKMYGPVVGVTYRF